VDVGLQDVLQSHVVLDVT